MGRIDARSLKGFRDHLPAANVVRQRLLRRVTGVFESFGFGPLTTPALEYTEILLGKYGEEGSKLLYRFEDHGGRDVALRYDLTVPLARVVAQHRNLEMPFRRYQIAPVWRAEKPGLGRYREFLQCDVDIVGEPSLRADAECIQVGLQVMAALGVEGAELRLNNRKVLDGLLDTLGLEGKERRQGVMRSVDKIGKIGRAGLKAELDAAGVLGPEGQERLFDFLDISVKTRDDLGRLRQSLEGSEVGLEGVAELEELLRLVDASGCRDQVVVDVSIARGLDYYTGTIYETFVRGHESYGSVMSGGRYDTLLGTFLKQDVPAVGISVGLDRLLALLVERGDIAEQATVGDLFVALFDEDAYRWAQEAASQLRQAGLNVEVSLRPQKLGKQFRYAEKKGFRWVLLAGPDERQAGKVALKDLSSGEQQLMILDELPEHLRA